MNRRNTLKTLLVGGIGAAVAGTTQSCDREAVAPASATEPEVKGYGLRTPYEAAHDERINREQFYTEDELADIAILANIIAPGGDGQPAATDTGIQEFMEFMAKDQPENHQETPRGGLAWLNSESNRRFGARFAEISDDQRIDIVDDIAYPEEAKDTPMAYGAKFFDYMRFMTLTCYFTSREGMMGYLGYEGNQPNVWDGVPQEVLDKHGKSYDPKYLPFYVNQDRRDEMAEWDAEKNLLTNG